MFGRALRVHIELYLVQSMSVSLVVSIYSSNMIASFSLCSSISYSISLRASLNVAWVNVFNCQISQVNTLRIIDIQTAFIYSSGKNRIRRVQVICPITKQEIKKCLMAAPCFPIDLEIEEMYTWAASRKKKIIWNFRRGQRISLTQGISVILFCQGQTRAPRAQIVHMIMMVINPFLIYSRDFAQLSIMQLETLMQLTMAIPVIMKQPRLWTLVAIIWALMSFIYRVAAWKVNDSQATISNRITNPFGIKILPIVLSSEMLQAEKCSNCTSYLILLMLKNMLKFAMSEMVLVMIAPQTTHPRYRNTNSQQMMWITMVITFETNCWLNF